MDFIDKETLNKLAQKYKQESMAAAVIDIVVNNDNTSVEKNDYGVMLLSYIQFIEGVRVRLKEIHWSTKSATEHEQTDYAIASITSLEDEIAESFMGIMDYRIRPGQLIPVYPSSEQYKDVLNDLSLQTLNVMKVFGELPALSGVVSKFEDMYVLLNKLVYLAEQE